MADKKNPAKLMSRQRQMPLAPPQHAHISDGVLEGVPTFLTATQPHSKITVTTIKNNHLAFSNRNITSAVAIKKKQTGVRARSAILDPNAVSTSNASRRTAGF
jgi:hypothetical protein